MRFFLDLECGPACMVCLVSTMKSISEVAIETGLTIDTLRYYEKIGLIPELTRSPGGRRIYSEADVTWISFLIQLKATGMPIVHMKKFAALRLLGDISVPERIDMLKRHRDEIEDSIDELRSFLHVVDTKIARHEKSLQQKEGGIT